MTDSAQFWDRIADKYARSPVSDEAASRKKLDEALTSIRELLEPGGLFLSNTACLADGMNWLRPILAVGRWIGKLPAVTFLGRDELVQRMQRTGFEIEHEYRPGKSKGRVVFLIARKVSR